MNTLLKKRWQRKQAKELKRRQEVGSYNVHRKKCIGFARTKLNLERRNNPNMIF